MFDLLSGSLSILAKQSPLENQNSIKLQLMFFANTLASAETTPFFEISDHHAVLFKFKLLIKKFTINWNKLENIKTVKKRKSTRSEKLSSLKDDLEYSSIEAS